MTLFPECPESNSESPYLYLYLKAYSLHFQLAILTSFGSCPKVSDTFGIDFWARLEMRLCFILLHVDVLFSQHCWRGWLFSNENFWHFVKVRWLQLWRFVPDSSTLSPWSVCLFVCLFLLPCLCTTRNQVGLHLQHYSLLGVAWPTKPFGLVTKFYVCFSISVKSVFLFWWGLHWIHRLLLLR